jgi:hypothetical protein
VKGRAIDDIFAEARGRYEVREQNASGSRTPNSHPLPHWPGNGHFWGARSRSAYPNISECEALLTVLAPSIGLPRDCWNRLRTLARLWTGTPVGSGILLACRRGLAVLMYAFVNGLGHGWADRDDGGLR